MNKSKFKTGDTVEKCSGKPFKSGLKYATVCGFTTNPNTGLPALVFDEDDSVVDERTCFVVGTDAI